MNGVCVLSWRFYWNNNMQGVKMPWTKLVIKNTSIILSEKWVEVKMLRLIDCWKLNGLNIVNHTSKYPHASLPEWLFTLKCNFRMLCLGPSHTAAVLLLLNMHAARRFSGLGRRGCHGNRQQGAMHGWWRSDRKNAQWKRDGWTEGRGGGFWKNLQQTFITTWLVLY